MHTESKPRSEATLDDLLLEMAAVLQADHRRWQAVLDAVDRRQFGAGYVKARDEQDERLARRATFRLIEGGSDAG